MPEREWIGKLCQLTHASSLQQICDLAYEIMGNPVFISDMAHTILAYTKCVEVDDESWQRHIVRADLERNTIIQSREVSTVHEASAETKMPVVVTDGQVPYPRLIKALVSEGQPVGVMVLTAYLRPLEQEDIQLMELISSFAETRLNRDRYHVTTDGNAVENYFIQLLEGAQYSREQVDKRMNVLGFSLRECAYVLCICPAQATERAGESLRPMLEEFKRLPFSRTFLYNSALVCVYSCGQDISNWETQAPKLTELLRRWELVAGVSRRLNSLERLRDYYRQAQSTLELGCRLQREFLYCRYDDLSSFQLFQCVPVERLMRYCHQNIQELGDYDRLHHTELCATLQVYLEQTKSLVRTAEILFIHRNTVRYRINKCMELLGSDLEDGNEIFAFILSLRMLEYRRKLLDPADQSSPVPALFPEEGGFAVGEGCPKAPYGRE